MKQKYIRKIPQKKKRETKKKAVRIGDNQRTYHHPQFGDIPLIQKVHIGSDGKEYPYFDFDPDYAPPLPPGAIRANVHRQSYAGYNAPLYYYQDRQKSCIQCGTMFTFTGKEQRYWYEVLAFSLYSDAIRCLSCRKKKRSDAFIQQQLMNASITLQEDRDNPGSLLSYAEAMITYYERFSEGNLSKAINACRTALKLDPKLAEARYWEGRCQIFLGRHDAATS